VCKQVEQATTPKGRKPAKLGNQQVGRGRIQFPQGGKAVCPRSVLMVEENQVEKIKSKYRLWTRTGVGKEPGSKVTGKAVRVTEVKKGSLATER